MYGKRFIYDTAVLGTRNQFNFHLDYLSTKISMFHTLKIGITPFCVKVYSYKYKFQRSGFVHYRIFNEKKLAKLNYT